MLDSGTLPAMPRARTPRPSPPPRPPSGPARVVLAMCAASGWPAPVYELRFAPPRLWRFDLAWPGARLAVEIQGGIYTFGRHVRGPALLREWEKLNTAALDGWAVLLVSPDQVTDGTLRDWLGRAFAARPWAVGLEAPAPDAAPLRLTLAEAAP